MVFPPKFRHPEILFMFISRTNRKLAEIFIPFREKAAILPSWLHAHLIYSSPVIRLKFSPAVISDASITGEHRPFCARYAAPFNNNSASYRQEAQPSLRTFYRIFMAEWFKTARFDIFNTYPCVLPIFTTPAFYDRHLSSDRQTLYVCAPGRMRITPLVHPGALSYIGILP